MYNMLVDYFQSKQVEFTECERKIFDKLMSTLCSVLWYLDGQEEKYKAASGCKLPPKVFFPKQFRKISHCGTVKKKPPNLCVNSLTEHATKLDSLLTLNVSSTNWNIARTDIANIKDWIDSYIDYLRQKSNENNNTLDRDLNTTLKTIKGNRFLSSLHQSIYRPLENRLAGSDFYVPVLIFEYSPIEKHKRYHYIRQVQMPFTIQVFRIDSPHAFYVWKIPTVLEDLIHDTNVSNIICRLTSAGHCKTIRELKEDIIQSHSNDRAQYTKNDFKATASFMTEDGEFF